MPPPADGLASRLFLGPALRAQPDRRLVTLAREGYEAAFEEIVRRYTRPLGRYAASIVGGRSEDVLQDAFAKALPALQRDDAEIELRPWLFRIVRNTALNDLRDSPPSAEALAERLTDGGGDPAEELERREELADLMRRLRELPEAQRAAIVMRELEGLGHEQIAAALGLSGGGARQAIYRARRALRDGAGLLLPLPLLRLLLEHGTEAATASAGGAIAAAGATAGGASAGGAVKAGVVAAVLAGSVGAGVAVHENRGDGEARAVGPAATAAAATAARRDPGPTGADELSTDDHSSRGGSDDRGGGEADRGGGHESGRSPGPGAGPPRHRGHRGNEIRLRPPERQGGHSGPGGGRDDGPERDLRPRDEGGRSGPGGGELREPRPDDRSGPGDGSEPPPEEEDVRSGESDSSGSGGDSGGRSGEPG